MKNQAITGDGGSIQLPRSHPVLAVLNLDPADGHKFQRLFADEPAVRILDHALLNGRMVVRVACCSREVSTRLEDGWG